jgi:glycosyltransferase involved in cell wall biosynthesis
MRSAPVELAADAAKAIAKHGYPDIVFCTDMLDLAQWRGLLRDPRITTTPTAIYFHENQWTYPVSPNSRSDSHFGYTNLVSAFAADACWFNSSFHLDDFLTSSSAFVDRMPDSKAVHDFDRLRKISQVIPPGFDPPENFSPIPRKENDPLILGWVSRWEYDKRPDGLLDLCRVLSNNEVDFRLTLLGQRPKATPKALTFIRDEFGDKILHDGYAESHDQYWSLLKNIDIVFSAADHEFFGIAVCEAIWAGAIPILPNRLSYPELAPASCLYDSIDEAATMIAALQDHAVRDDQNPECRKQIESMLASKITAQLDDELSSLLK